MKLGRVTVGHALAFALVACARQPDAAPVEPQKSNATSTSNASQPSAAPSPAPAVEPFVSSDQMGAPGASEELKVGPPDAVENCHEKLAELHVDFKAAEMPLKQSVGGVFTCGAHDAVIYEQGPGGIRLSPPALMTCRMAVAFAGLEGLMQELAKQHLGSEIQRVQHVGTYNCRKMVRFDLVSEHSYGNAIDIASFVLKDGRKLSVLKDFGKLAQPPQGSKALFLRQLGEQAFVRSVVSVSLGPYWDAAHRDHFHFDMARYRVDGSRPSSPVAP